MIRFLILPVLIGMVGCTGSRTMYDNNGLRIVQTGADPTVVNGGYNVLVVEQDGASSVIAVSATGTLVEQLAMPAATVTGAVIIADAEGDNITVSSSSNSKSKSKSSADRNLTINR